MATYDETAVSDIQIGHKKGMTIQQGRALRDNPIAMMEGSSGAPKLDAPALNILLLTGSGDVTDLDRVDYVICLGKVSVTHPGSGTAATATVQYSLSTDNGSSFGATTDVTTVSDSSGTGGNAESWALINMTSSNALRITHVETAGTGTAAAESFTFGVQGTSP